MPIFYRAPANRNNQHQAITLLADDEAMDVLETKQGRICDCIGIFLLVLPDSFRKPVLLIRTADDEPKLAVRGRNVLDALVALHIDI